MGNQKMFSSSIVGRQYLLKLFRSFFILFLLLSFFHHFPFSSFSFCLLCLALFILILLISFPTQHNYISTLRIKKFTD